MLNIMVIVKLIGGLGNQFFQYAVGRSLSVANKCELKLDATGFKEYKLHKYSLNNFNIKEVFATDDELKYFTAKPNWLISKYAPFLTSKKYVPEGEFGYHGRILKLKGDVYLEGYWQTEKYFQSIQKMIRDEFSVRHEISGIDFEIAKKMKEVNSVSIHVRRADYVSNPQAKAMHGNCSLEYYQKAVDLISKSVEKPVFFVFSDDYEWVKDNVHTGFETIFVHHNNADKNYEDLRLMSTCKHNIVANSSFSWWGAWLNNNPAKIVVAPKKWFANPKIISKDIIPESWIKI